MGPLALWLLRGGRNLGRPFWKGAKKLFDPRRTRFEEGAQSPIKFVDEAGVEHWGPSTAVRWSDKGNVIYPKGPWSPARGQRRTKTGKVIPTRGARPARGRTPAGGTRLGPGIKLSAQKAGYSPRGAPAGFFPRHPGTSLLTAGALGTAGGLSLMGESDEELAEKQAKDAAASAQSLAAKAREALETKVESSQSPGHYAEYKKKSRARLKKGMKQLLNQYMILSYTSPDHADKFLNAGMKLIEADADFNEDMYSQDIYDTVFQPGSMPSSGREAFGALVSQGLDPQEAMEFTGNYSDLFTESKEHLTTKKEELQWKRIVANVDGTALGLETAANALAAAWVSGSIKADTNVSMMPIDEKKEYAKEVISSLVGMGETGSEDVPSNWFSDASMS